MPWYNSLGWGHNFYVSDDDRTSDTPIEDIQEETVAVRPTREREDDYPPYPGVVPCLLYRAGCAGYFWRLTKRVFYTTTKG